MSEEIVKIHKARIDNFRTGVLDIGTIIETFLEFQICHIFGKTERIPLMKSMLFDNTFLDFDSKINIIEKAMQKFHPQILDENPQWISQIRELKKMRNLVAHKITQDGSEDFKKDAENKRMTLAYYDGVTEKTIIKTYDEMKEYSTIMLELVQTTRKISDSIFS